MKKAIKTITVTLLRLSPNIVHSCQPLVTQSKY